MSKSTDKINIRETGRKSDVEHVIMPLQPIKMDKTGCVRFVPNRIVEALLETSTLDLNNIACMDFTQQEHEQLAQLIGYSISGFGELSYVSDETYGAAEEMYLGVNELEARNIFLRATLESVRAEAKNIVTKLFKIHPDDLDA